MGKALLLLGAIVVVFGLGVLAGRSSVPGQTGSGIEGTTRFGGWGKSAHYSAEPQKVCQRVFRNRAHDNLGSAVTHFCTRTDGSYRLSLPPGRYTIVGDDFHVLASAPIEVRADAYTSVDLVYDNGMRG